MEILSKLESKRPKLKVALFDFDGTISTLRHGWESIMEPLMLEMITGSKPANDEQIKEVREYIGQSTGIQTIYQMEWLVEKVKRSQGKSSISDDPWWYKEEYNKRLMKPVQKRKDNIIKGKNTKEDFLVMGSKELLESLIKNGIEIYVASGTDDIDVKKEADVLGLTDYFKEIAGAPAGKADCSKEAVLRKLIEENKLMGSEVVVIGDGKVEIALGREVGAITLGVACNEEKLYGLDMIKRERLVKAGAHAIVGDYRNIDEILKWLGLS